MDDSPRECIMYGIGEKHYKDKSTLFTQEEVVFLKRYLELQKMGWLRKTYEEEIDFFKEEFRRFIKLFI